LFGWFGSGAGLWRGRCIGASPKNRLARMRHCLFLCRRLFCAVACSARGRAAAPLLLSARGRRLLPAAPGGWPRGTERRTAQRLWSRTGEDAERASCEARAPCGAPSRGGLCRRGRASGTGQGLVFPLVPQAFARVHPAHVQPRRAAPHSRGGRLPGTSRTRGCEPRAQAAAPSPAAMTPHDNAPRKGKMSEGI